MCTSDLNRSESKTSATWPFLVALLLFVAGSVARAEEGPDQLIRTVAADVLKVMRDDQMLVGGDSSKVAEVIEAKIAPHFDFERMTRLAVGRSWRQATPTQQEVLIQQFRKLLIRSYAAAYKAEYKNVSVDVRPLRVLPGVDDVEVKSQITLPGNPQPVSVDYSMYRSGATWKVYDISVEGISLIATYRSVFSEEIKRGGVEGLVRSLTEKNVRAAIPASQQ